MDNMKNLKVLSNDDLLTLYRNINEYIKILEDAKNEVMESEEKDDK